MTPLWPTCSRCAQVARPGTPCARRDCPFARELEPPGMYVRQLVIKDPTAEVKREPGGA